eukprot:CAMPEP_0171537238 /NCGR_PEP_ID=MMETSP0959-20130129/18366_1 /TAXON_ID=87120 /ORGANISM="Aurantiochytrium limacinum, Strain ATCCMYA-1381" /LENGTH=55 /DNA_ID=CAMNT_0012083807 /DNA_START=347 /DNA_END=514 /DNA_ORIENTATION=-
MHYLEDPYDCPPGLYLTLPNINKRMGQKPLLQGERFRSDHGVHQRKIVLLLAFST